MRPLYYTKTHDNSQQKNAKNLTNKKSDKYRINLDFKPLFFIGFCQIPVIPGLCFDESYNRLGYGRGYYDRYLINTKGYKIGVTFKELFFKKDTIIAGLTDIKMDKIIKD